MAANGDRDYRAKLKKIGTGSAGYDGARSIPARRKPPRYERSDDYRYLFIRNNPPKNGKYRCAYCGKRVSKDRMQVDHVIPVHGARTLRGRILLAGTQGVNDLANLVPSCPACNKKKGASMSCIWRIRARLGIHGWYWALRKALICSFLVGVACMILLLYMRYGV